MMKIRLRLLLVGLLLITGCNKASLDPQHEQYLLNKGWTINEAVEVKTYILNIPNEMLPNYEASGVYFLGEYIGEEVTAYTYELKEKDEDGNNLLTVLFEVDEEIIGGYGNLPSWTPGMFSLDDKSRLIREQLIK